MADAARQSPESDPRSSSYDEGAIEVLKFPDAVRQRPGMYVGNTGDGSGLHQMVCNVVQNAIDEATASDTGVVTVTLNPEGSVTVTDEGCGISIDLYERKGVVFGSVYGAGLWVVNALSTSLKLRSWRDGKEHFMEFADGNAVTPLKLVGEANGQCGTEVTFTPSPQIFTIVKFDFAALVQRLRELVVPNSHITIVLSDKRDAVVTREVLRHEGDVEHNPDL
jgi:DNA gyrase subunit B